MIKQLMTIFLGYVVKIILHYFKSSLPNSMLHAYFCHFDVTNVFLKQSIVLIIMIIINGYVVTVKAALTISFM